jgi:pilus assembly protein TadC
MSRTLIDISRVGTEIVSSHPLLANLFANVALELRAGKSREMALRTLARRTAIPEISAFTTLIIQSDKLGASIATALKVYATEMREARRMRAEEKAMRIPVLLSIPLGVATVFAAEWLAAAFKRTKWVERILNWSFAAIFTAFAATILTAQAQH